MLCPRCKNPIEEHVACRETDACVAQIVMKQHPPFGNAWLDQGYPYSRRIAAAKKASDMAGRVVVFAPNSSVRDGSYANRKKEWLVEIIPDGGTTKDAVWAYGETEELARCRAALLLASEDYRGDL